MLSDIWIRITWLKNEPFTDDVEFDTCLLEAAGRAIEIGDRPTDSRAAVNHDRVDRTGLGICHHGSIARSARIGPGGLVSIDLQVSHSDIEHLLRVLTSRFELSIEGLVFRTDPTGARDRAHELVQTSSLRKDRQ